jgi:hypothetical protein
VDFAVAVLDLVGEKRVGCANAAVRWAGHWGDS